MGRGHTISSSPARALHSERRQRWLSLRLLASLGLLSLAVFLLITGRNTPSFVVAPMVLTMLATALLFPLHLGLQALAASVVAAGYLLAADWSHAGLAEELGTFAAAGSGILLSVVTVAWVQERRAARSR